VSVGVVNIEFGFVGLASNTSIIVESLKSDGLVVQIARLVEARSERNVVEGGDAFGAVNFVWLEVTKGFFSLVC
jgi:hypothetical protein